MVIGSRLFGREEILSRFFLNYYMPSGEKMKDQINQKDKAEMPKLAEKAYAWSCNVELPQVLKGEIDAQLRLTATCHEHGVEMRHVVVAITGDNTKHFLDASEVPPEVLAPVIMMMAEKTKAVAIVMTTEAWTVPEEVMKRMQDAGISGNKLKDQPEAYEVVIVQVETKLGTYAGFAPLLGKKGNYTVKDTIELAKRDTPITAFDNMLPGSEGGHSPHHLLQMLQALKFMADQDPKMTVAEILSQELDNTDESESK